MIVALGGMFRNASGYLDRYFKMVEELRELLERRGDRLRLVVAEGDSSDDTRNQLISRLARYDHRLIFRDHGKRWWGSVDDPERWVALSWVCNGILENLDADVDRFVYVETDLAWAADTMISLINQLSDEHPAVAPMCFTAVGDFYDIWGHIKDGVNFSPFPPYHYALRPGLTKVDSVGSCITMLGHVARAVRYGPNDLVRGLGRSIYQNGYSLWLDSGLKVVHL